MSASGLIRYEEARRALQQAVKPIQAKSIRDKVMALEVYAKQALDHDLEVWAAELRVRAERRMGELLEETPKHRGGRPKNGTVVIDVTATLEKLGITKKQSALAQHLAAIPVDAFEAYIQECRLIGQPPRSRILVRAPRDDKLAVHHRSDNEEHYTPPHIVALVRACFGGDIDLDPSCNPGDANVPAGAHFRKTDDGLKQRWHGRVFCNPPYGAQTMLWIEKALTEFQCGHTDAIILLLAARPDTGWFHALRDFPVCFIRGRLTFIGNADPAPFPSALFWISETPLDVFAATCDDLGTTYVRYGP